MSRCVLKINRQSTEKPHIVLTIETAYFFSDDHHISGYEYFGSWALFSFFWYVPPSQQNAGSCGGAAGVVAGLIVRGFEFCDKKVNRWPKYSRILTNFKTESHEFASYAWTQF